VEQTKRLEAQHPQKGVAFGTNDEDTLGATTASATSCAENNTVARCPGHIHMKGYVPDGARRKINAKKRFASLRLCVSFLLRDHANLLCIVKRLFNGTSTREGQQVGGHQSI